MADALWTADMTTGPRGEAVDYPDRLAEILSRYEPDSAVSRAMTQARPLIEAAINRTEDRLRKASLCAARAGDLPHLLERAHVVIPPAPAGNPPQVQHR